MHSEKKSVTEIKIRNKEIGIWGMDETNSPSAVVSSEEKLNLPPCKFFVTVVLSDSSTSQHAGKLSVVHVALSGFIHLLCVY